MSLRIDTSDTPVILQLYVTDGSVTTSLVQVEEHPFRLVVNVSVKLPATPAVTFTVEPVEEPTIEPLPLIDQLYELKFAGAVY